MHFYFKCRVKAHFETVIFSLVKTSRTLKEFISLDLENESVGALLIQSRIRKYDREDDSIRHIQSGTFQRCTGEIVSIKRLENVKVFIEFCYETLCILKVRI